MPAAWRLIYNNLILTFILYFCRLHQYLTNIDLAEVNFSEEAFLSGIYYFLDVAQSSWACKTNSASYSVMWKHLLLLIGGVAFTGGCKYNIVNNYKVFIFKLLFPWIHGVVENLFTSYPSVKVKYGLV